MKKKIIKTKRNTWVACPYCGRRVARVRICDMELRCKHCGRKFVAIIGAERTSAVRDGGKPYTTEPVKQAQT